jgi:hypothetical protein
MPKQPRFDKRSAGTPGKKPLKASVKRRAGGKAQLTSGLIPFVERGFPQANWVALTKPCRCNNSTSDDFARHIMPTNALKLFKGSF